jgi:hypothetical protein
LTDIALDHNNSPSIHFNVSVENRAEEPARFTHFDLYIDEDLQMFNFPSIETFEPDSVECELDGNKIPMTRYSISWVTPDQPPIWKGVDRKLYPARMGAHVKQVAREYLVVVAVSSPHMSRRTSIFRIRPTELHPAKRVELCSNVEFKLSDS